MCEVSTHYQPSLGDSATCTQIKYPLWISRLSQDFCLMKILTAVAVFFKSHRVNSPLGFFLEHDTFSRPRVSLLVLLVFKPCFSALPHTQLSFVKIPRDYAQPLSVTSSFLQMSLAINPVLSFFFDLNGLVYNVAYRKDCVIPPKRSQTQDQSLRWYKC